MVMTPSWPTFSMASAIRVPMASSPEGDRAHAGDVVGAVDLLAVGLHGLDGGSGRLGDALLHDHGVMPAAWFFRPPWMMA